MGKQQNKVGVREASNRSLRRAGVEIDHKKGARIDHLLDKLNSSSTGGN